MPEVCFRIVLGELENTGIQKQKTTGRCWQLIFIPQIGEDESNLTSIFSDG